MQVKLIFLSIFYLGLIGCDQVRDKLTNGFDWDRKISSINNNELPPKNANLNSNITTYQAPLGAGKPLDKTRISPPGAENSKSQTRPAKPPKKTAAAIPDSQIDLTSDVPDPADAQAVAMPKPVRRSLYKNVSGMSENDW